MSRASKVAVAFLLGVLGLFLGFLLGEGFRIPATVPTAICMQRIISIGVIGGYFLVCEYVLSRGNPQALRKDWAIVLALNLAVLVTASIALVIEPNKLAALQALGMAIFTVACSYAGAALAARRAAITIISP